MGLKPLSVVVLDAGGHVLAFEREDGSSPGRFEIARGKAYGAVMLGMPGSAQMARAEQQAYFMAAVNGAYGGKVVPVPGGVLVDAGRGRDRRGRRDRRHVRQRRGGGRGRDRGRGVRGAWREAMTERRLISSGSPFEAEIGYSRAVVCDGWVFVAGTTGFDYATMEISGDVAEQAAQTFRNIDAALREAGRRWPTWCGCATSCPMAGTGRPAGR
jgi:hypothetical protein